MPLRIPTDVGQQTQQALRDLDLRLSGVEKSQVIPEVSKADLNQLSETLRAEIRRAANFVPAFPTVAAIMRPSGGSHAAGAVPDPGAAGGTDQILHEDAQWKWPLAGRLIEVTQSGDAVDSFGLHGGLIIDGPIVASTFGAGFLIGQLPGHKLATLNTLITVNNSTALVTSADLSLAVEANTSYRFQGVLTFSSGTTPNCKVALSLPASPTTFRMSVVADSACIGTSTATTSGGTVAINGIGAGINTAFIIAGFIKTGTAAGIIAVQFAQNTADVSDTILRTTSYIELQQV